GEHEAGTGGAAVDEHGAGPADSLFTAQVGAGEAEVVAQQVGQRQPGGDGGLHRVAVDGGGEVHLGRGLGHGCSFGSSWARAWAWRLASASAPAATSRT